MITSFIQDSINKFFDSNTYNNLLEKLWEGLLLVWNYQIFETDHQEIHLGNVIISFTLFIVGIKIVKHITLIIKTKLVRSIKQVGMVNTLTQVSYYFLMTLMIVLVLDVSHIPLTIFTILGTTLAVGIGLGSQNLVANFISGVVLMIERPIQVGDIVEIKNISGEVTTIGTRSTIIKTFDNKDVILPNSNILQDAIINWTLEDGIHKNYLNFEITQNTNIDEVEKFILRTLKKHPNILDIPEAQVTVISFNSESYSIEISFWVDLLTNISAKKIINDINRELIKVFKENNIIVVVKSSCGC